MSAKEEENREQLNEVFKRLKELERQTEKIVGYQKLSYRWAMQHHSNLKQMLLRINEVVENLRKAGIIPEFSKLIMIEDPTLLPYRHEEQNQGSNPATSSTSLGREEDLIIVNEKESFHDQVMRFKDAPFAPKLTLLLKNIVENDLRALQEESFIIALINVLTWFLQEVPNFADQQVGLLILVLGIGRFPRVFQKRAYDELLEDYIAILKHLCQNSDHPVWEDGQIKREDIIEVLEILIQSRMNKRN